MPSMLSRQRASGDRMPEGTALAAAQHSSLRTSAARSEPELAGGKRAAPQSRSLPVFRHGGPRSRLAGHAGAGVRRTAPSQSVVGDAGVHHHAATVSPHCVGRLALARQVVRRGGGQQLRERVALARKYFERRADGMSSSRAATLTASAAPLAAARVRPVAIALPTGSYGASPAQR